MKCPVDGATLQMTEREGVEIDYCPECRGVWLDGRELDRILERAMAREMQGRPSGGRDDDREYGRDLGRDHPRGKDRDYYYHGKKKDRLGFLGDLLGGD